MTSYFSQFCGLSEQFLSWVSHWGPRMWLVQGWLEQEAQDGCLYACGHRCWPRCLRSLLHDLASSRSSDHLPCMLFSRQHSEREKARSDKLSWGLGSDTFLSFLPPSVDQTSLQGQPRFKGLETETPPQVWRCCKSIFQKWVHTGMERIFDH